MTDDAYTKLTPAQRSVRAAFKADLGRYRGDGPRASLARMAADLRMPEGEVAAVLAQLKAVAVRYWLGKGAAA